MKYLLFCHFLERLAEETRAATKIKEQQPLLIVTGNPPWSGHSENLGVLLDGIDIVEPFKWCDGVRVQQTKWINNDYVKFIRWAQWRLTQSPAQLGEQAQMPAPAGIVALITDNSYISGPTFRGMRRFLLTQFDEIYVINLFGNVRSGGSGAGEESIFEIKQGVCITLLVRHNMHTTAQPQDAAAPSADVRTLPFLAFEPENRLPDRLARDDEEVQHMISLSQGQLRAKIRSLSSTIGTRAEKYTWLDNLTWPNVKDATLLHPEAPFYFFKPFEADLAYSSWPAVNEIFEAGEMCVTTGNDDERVFFSRAEVLAALSDAPAAEVQPYAYRPFDQRWIWHNSGYLERARMSVMQHLHYPNRALIVLRQTRRQEIWCQLEGAAW